MQFTLSKSKSYSAKECFGSNEVSVSLHPAPPNTGVAFATSNGIVAAKIENAYFSHSSIMLKSEEASVLNVEHMLAVFFAYGLDNVLVELKRKPSKSYLLLDKLGIANKAEVVPCMPGREVELCNLIADNLEEQNLPRKNLYLNEDILTPKLDIIKADCGLSIAATTDYHLAGRQELSLRINAANFYDELAASRPYAKHVPPGIPEYLLGAIASVANISFGLGHGFSKDIVFLPQKTKEDWLLNQPNYPAGDEIVRHSIVDRLGALALLPGRLDCATVLSRFSGHKDDLKVLKDNLHCFSAEKKF